MTEGFLQNHIKSTSQSLRVAYGNPPPFTQGRLDMRLSVNVNLYVICCGQGQALSLRYDIEFNLIATVSYNISANYLGRSKPLPYIVGYNFSLRAKHQLLRIADSRNGCPHSALLTPHSATVLPPFHRAGLLFERRTEFDVAAAFHTDARNQMLAGFANFNA